MLEQQIYQKMSGDCLHGGKTFFVRTLLGTTLLMGFGRVLWGAKREEDEAH